MTYRSVKRAIMKNANFSVLSSLCLTLGLSACAMLDGTPSETAAPAAPTAEELRQATIKTNAQDELQHGIAQFNKGDYSSAVNTLNGGVDIWQSDATTQAAALKYLAFSYCLTKQKAACKNSFEKAFKVDPSFDLSVAERGHPIWGPVFSRVKQAQSSPDGGKPGY
jgi:Tfp pilus assembly protein PilF